MRTLDLGVAATCALRVEDDCCAWGSPYLCCTSTGIGPPSGEHMVRSEAQSLAISVSRL
jgi:hypothetical protein